MTDATDKTQYRFLHTMIRVKDLEKSLDFYTRHLGMSLLRRREFPDGRFTLAFVGYGEEADNTVIELTHNWDQEDAYDLGSAFGHLAVAVPDVYGTCEALEREGVSIPAAGADEIRRQPDPYGVHRGPGRLPDRADPAVVERRSAALGERYEATLLVPGVELARPADLLVGVFDHLVPLGDPSHRAGDGEQDREHADRDADRLEDDARIEVDIGVQAALDEIAVFQGDALELQRQLEQRLGLDSELSQHSWQDSRISRARGSKFL